MTAAHDPAAQRLGILVALLGILLFALNDTLGKWLVATYTIGQVLLLRSAAALIILIPLMWVARTRLFPVERPKLQTARVAASTLEVFCFYFAVRSLPLADVMTYWLAAPIYVAALSPWLLGEHVGPWRWGAIFLGFVGVVVALQPGGGGLSPAILISIIGSFAFALMVLSARSLRATPDYALVFWQTLGALAAGIVLAPFDWVPPSAPGSRASRLPRHRRHGRASRHRPLAQTRRRRDHRAAALHHHRLGDHLRLARLRRRAHRRISPSAPRSSSRRA